MTFATETEAKVVGRVSTGVPEACNCTPPLTVSHRANSALVTPTSTPPAVNSALAPWATTWMSSPCFRKPKLPASLTKPPNWALIPSINTAVVLSTAFSAALIV